MQNKMIKLIILYSFLFRGLVVAETSYKDFLIIENIGQLNSLYNDLDDNTSIQKIKYKYERVVWYSFVYWYSECRDGAVKKDYGKLYSNLITRYSVLLKKEIDKKNILLRIRNINGTLKNKEEIKSHYSDCKPPFEETDFVDEDKFNQLVDSYLKWLKSKDI